jgi:outer membrane protein OmpA-like peptidoglycan-associated protein
MARADLSAMLNRLEETPNSTTTTTPSPTATEVRTQKSPEPKNDSNASQGKQATKAAPRAPLVQSAGYLSFDRKETRLRPDQYAVLTEHARRLNRAKGTGGERITENTLIRVAIDLLLARADQLQGVDETELRNSVSL